MHPKKLATGERYPTIIVVLHWLIVFLTIAMIPMGKNLAALDPQADKLILMQIHAMTGMTIILLSVVRMALHLKGPLPAPDPSWSGWMNLVSKVVHWGLMIVSLLVLVSGAVSFVGFGFLDLVKAGQWAPWPNTEAIPPLDGHRLMIKVLIGLIALHALAALYHQFVRKEQLFQRMWFGSKEE
ncbi:MAG: cytochrome b/b6 domain-containing protein [Rhodospirillales bacterium]|nr:cytochrome b/b6 domain-containing protein [Rhodospirillales bacterium]